MSETDAPLLRWCIEPTPDATILRTTGEIDLSTQPDFSAGIQAATRTSAALIVIDLSRVTFIGSTGVQLLLSLHFDVQHAGRQLRVAHGGSQARRTFEIAGIQHTLAVYNTVADALVR